MSRPTRGASSLLIGDTRLGSSSASGPCSLITSSMNWAVLVPDLGAFRPVPIALGALTAITLTGGRSGSGVFSRSHRRSPERVLGSATDARSR